MPRKLRKWYKGEYPFDLHAGRHSGTETTVKASELYGKNVLRV